MNIRVAVVDDQVLVRGGFAMVLGHQGDIEVDSGYQGGARFVIRLPLLDVQQQLPSEMLNKQQEAENATMRYV